MKKIALTIVIILSLFMLSACSNTIELPRGRYFLENSENVYIYVERGHILSFHNVDFSKAQASLIAAGESMGLDFSDIDVAQELSGSLVYEINEEGTRIFLDLIGVLSLSLDFDSTMNSLTFFGDVFILR